MKQKTLHQSDYDNTSELLSSTSSLSLKNKQQNSSTTLPSPKVAKTLVGKVLKSAVQHLDSEPSLRSDFGLTESVYQQRLKKPKRPTSLKKRHGKGQSPRNSQRNNLRGTLRPSTYIHIPPKKHARKTVFNKRRKEKKRNERKVIETVIIGTYENEHGITITSSPNYKQMNSTTITRNAPITTPTVKSPSSQHLEGDKTDDGETKGEGPKDAEEPKKKGGDLLRFRGFLRGITAIKRKAKAMRDKEVHAKPVLLLMGNGHLELMPEGGRHGKWDIKREFTLEAWLFAPRTETLFAETSANVRKHTGVVTDSDGSFKCWKCCSREDSNIFGWCPAWQGDMTQSVTQSYNDDGGGDEHVRHHKHQKHEKKERQEERIDISKDQKLKEGIFAPHRTNPCVIFSRPGQFVLHDTGGYCAENGKTYGFSITSKDGVVSTLTQFSIPVDRWFALSAVYDGYYLKVYIDGEEAATERREKDTCAGMLNQSDSNVIVGGDFTGMISHIRVWNTARSKIEISNAIRNRVSVKEVHNSGLPGHVSSSAAADEVFVPNPVESGTATSLLADIAIYNVNNFDHGHIEDSSIYGHNAHFFCDHFAWRINPPMFYGAPRPYTHTSLTACYHQRTTIAHNKQAAAWGWYPISALAEMVRSWGKIRILARWDHNQPFDSAAVAFCHRFIHLLAKQDFPQDWIFDIRSTTTVQNSHLPPCTSDSNEFTFFLAMSHLDMNGSRHERVLFTSTKAETIEFPDCKPLLYQVEYEIRLYTTFWHSDVFKDVKHMLRAKLTASKDETAGTRTLRSVLLENIKAQLLYKLLENIHKFLPTNTKTGVDKRTGISASQLTQNYFEISIWMIGVDNNILEMVTYGTKLAAHRLNVRRKAEIDAQKVNVMDMKLNRHLRHNVGNNINLSSTNQITTVDNNHIIKPMKKHSSSDNTVSMTNTSYPKPPTAKHLNIGSTLCMYGDKLDATEKRRTSFSMAFSWRTRLKTNNDATAVAGVLNVDLALIALDAAGVPLDSVHRYYAHSQDHAVVAHGRPRDMRKVLHDMEVTSAKSTSVAQTFDIDLNVVSKAVKSFVFVLHGNYQDACSELGICTMRIHRHEHDANVVNMLVREGKRRGHPISNTMAITTGMEELGSYSIDVSGLHAGLILCTLDRIDNGEWLLKSLRMPFSRELHIVEQIACLWPSLRLHTTARRPCVEIMYCSECEKHQVTTWHVPGAFRNLYTNIVTAIQKVYPSILIKGVPTTKTIGAFEITFQKFKGASPSLLYSAIDSKGWLPTAELAVRLVTHAMEADHLKDVKHEWPYNHDHNARSRLKFKVLDGYYKTPIPGAEISVHSIDSSENLQASLDQVLKHKQAKAELDALEGKRHNKYESVHANIITNANGESEIVLNATETYVCHFSAPGFYAKGHPPLRIGVAVDDAEKRKRGLLSSFKESVHEVTILLMPKIQHVRVSLVDFENGSAIEAAGLSITLTNMRSGFQHLSLTNEHGFAEFYVPIGRYEESVHLPEWSHIPYSIEHDRAAMRFLETAKSFDAARRGEVELHKRGIVVYGHTHDRVRVPGLRWPYHFTVYDASTAKPLVATVTVKNRDTDEILMKRETSQSNGTVIQMLPIYSDMTLCITAVQGATKYFSYQEDLAVLLEYKTPCVHSTFLCPVPPPGCGRLILSWTYPMRQKIDLIVQHYVYANDEDEVRTSPYTTVWMQARKSELAELDVVPDNGIAPTSALVKLLPNSEFRFHAQQRGIFDQVLANEKCTKSLHETNLQLRFYDEHGLVTTQLAKERLIPKEKDDSKFHVWENAFIVRVEENQVLSLDENEFMIADTKIAMANNNDINNNYINGRDSKPSKRLSSGNVISIGDRQTMSRTQALKLFRLIDPTFTNETISVRRFLRSVHLKQPVQDFIANRPELVNLLSIYEHKNILAALDTNGDDKMSVDDLLVFASNLTLSRIHDLFTLVAPNHNGSIQVTDFILRAQVEPAIQEFLKDTPALSTLCNTHTYINDLMEIDGNNDNAIDIDEMYNFVCNRAYMAKHTGKHLIANSDGDRMVFLSEMDTRQYIRSIFNMFKPGHHDVVTATTFIRAIKYNIKVRDMLVGHPYLKPLPFAKDLEGLCESIDKNNDGLITIDEVLLFARTLRMQQEALMREEATKMEIGSSVEILETKTATMMEPDNKVSEMKTGGIDTSSNVDVAKTLTSGIKTREDGLINADNTPANDDINQTINEIFELIDADNNGILEKHEMLKAFLYQPKLIKMVDQFPRLKLFLSPRQFENQFVQLQTAIDGRITRNEFADFISKNI